MTISMKRTAGILLLALIAAAPAAAQTAPSPLGESADRVQAAIAASIASQNISGLSVAVVIGNEVKWSGGYGFADLENFVPFTATTVWRLGSISKPITAVAAMRLAESGRLDLDAPIQGTCPAFPSKTQPITARELLGHLSGIRHYNPDENFNSTRHYESVPASLDAFKSDPLLQEPGAAYTYSTYGYVVLGCVVEGASGKPYAEFIRESVTRPAGMDRTRVDDQASVVPNRARGYAKAPSGELRNADLADTSNKVPGGGLVSSAVDLARFAIALNTNKLLKAETFQQMQVPMKTKDGKDSPYFGWTIVDRKGEKLLTHGGSQQGTSTYLAMLPARGFAVAILANTESVNVGALARQLTDMLAP